ncbi:glycosyltransferase family 4 protein [Chloroflexota bacterium]
MTSNRLNIGIVTSKGCIYPSLRHPNYMDQDNCFKDLSNTHDVYLVGNIIAERGYARSQCSFSFWKNQSLLWNNRYTSCLSPFPPVAWLRNLLDNLSDNLYTTSYFPCLEKYQVDIIYSFSWPFDCYAARWAQKLGKPLILEMWEDYACFTAITMERAGIPVGVIRREEDRIYRWMRDMADAAARVLVPTRVFAERLSEIGVPEDKINIARVPVAVPLATGEDDFSIRNEYNIEDNTQIIFYLGANSSRHDLTTLLEAVPVINGNPVLIIAGNSREELRKTANSLVDGQVRIIFTGPLEEDRLQAYITQVDICVAPYYFPKPSGFFPGKVVRYMVAGRAIVATDLPETREMFRGEPAGILVPQKDADALSGALNSLLSDGNMRETMGQTARKIATASYLFEHHTQKLLEIIREVISLS